MYQKYYQNFLKGHEGKIHLAAHSHHFWPDISFEGAKQAWLDAAALSDNKWNHIFGEVIPKTQKLIANIINLSAPEQIAFAPNTHELLFRVLSCFFEQEKVKVVTTTSEFHSFSRQIARLKEWDKFEVIAIDNESEHFEQEFLNAINSQTDIIFISHVFFNSGKILSNEFIQNIIDHKSEKTVFCLDAYHGFCAIPTDIGPFEDDLFYLAGGYKYAQAGEGVCFMSVPKNCKLRPLNTGWFASFDSLESAQEEVSYAQDGMRFWGATQDVTGFYRFNYVWSEFKDVGLDIEKIHRYIQSLQTQFLNNLIFKESLLIKDLSQCGHFITLELKTAQEAKEIHDWLADEGIITDYRANRLRFGFGLFLTQDDISKASELINQKYLKKFS
jgi:selenocysteine lyase/cysteine desulfurase